MVVYTNSLLENYVNQINPDIKLSEVWLLEIRLYGEDNLIFVFFYKSPIPTRTSEKNNANSHISNSLLCKKKCNQ